MLMLCGLFAESSLLGRDHVLTGVIQLAGHMLTACTAAHRSLSAWVMSAASATATNATTQAASVADSPSCDVIDLTADDDGLGSSNRGAADTEAASRHELSQPPSGQCKVESSHQAAVPEEDMPHQQGMVPGQPQAPAQQAGILLQPTLGLPDQAESIRAGSVSQAEAASTMHEGPRPLPVGEGAIKDLCMLCAYGMDLAALVSCLLSQVETWSGNAYCFCLESTAAECINTGVVHSQLLHPQPAVTALLHLPCCDCPAAPHFLCHSQPNDLAVP